MPTRHELWVPGIPRPQGSKRLVGRRLIEANPELRHWRNLVTLFARMEHQEPGVLVAPPVVCDLVFHMPKAQRPRWGHPTASGDLDKLVRAVLDSLVAAEWFDDDRHVVLLRAEKRYATPLQGPGVEVAASTMCPRTAPA